MRVPFGGANALVAVMKLNSGSAASGTGDQTTCQNTPINNLDEALNERPSGKPNCDIGAFESGIVPVLAIKKTHSDPFTQGQKNATYTITVDNNSGTDSTIGTVTVTDTLPAELTATAIAGAPLSNWNCILATLTCTINDVLPSGSSYPDITLTVDVAMGAMGPVTNTANVAGGGSGNATVDDVTTIQAPTGAVPDLTITKMHIDPFARGQMGDTYTITVSNIGDGPTDGSLVTVIDNLPMGLTARNIAGNGWSCTMIPPAGVAGIAMLSCTRSDVLVNGSPYPAITLTVDIAANAPSPVTNTVTVSGGGETNLSNDTASDPATTPVTLQSFEVN